MAIQAAEAPTVDAEIAAAAAATEALARQYFGDTAYLRLDTHEDHETGEESTVFEVHYCFGDPENDFERLEPLHEAFMDGYVHITSPDVLARVILKPIPSETE
ncbi:MAG TPA: hypothetical protein VEX86_25770 [Longimicrobium sp.]|nr:hypothetical protein [Longimicrobium sp.]